MPNSKQIVEHVIKAQYGLEEVDMTANFYDDYGSDDLDILEIIMELEEQLSIEIPDDDYMTGQDVLDAVEAQES